MNAYKRYKAQKRSQSLWALRNQIAEQVAPLVAEKRRLEELNTVQ